MPDRENQKSDKRDNQLKTSSYVYHVESKWEKFTDKKKNDSDDRSIFGESYKRKERSNLSEKVTFFILNDPIIFCYLFIKIIYVFL